MTERCVNNFCGFCDEGAEFGFSGCKFAKPWIEEHTYYVMKGGERINDNCPTLILHDFPLMCTAQSSDLIDMFEECWYCDGTPEYEEDDGEKYCLCPVDYPEECPRKILVEVEVS